MKESAISFSADSLEETEVLSVDSVVVPKLTTWKH